MGCIAKLGGDAVLLRIAKNDDLDFEVRNKAKNSISDDMLRKSAAVKKDAVYEAMYNMDIKSGM